MLREWKRMLLSPRFLIAVGLILLGNILLFSFIASHSYPYDLREAAKLRLELIAQWEDGRVTLEELTVRYQEAEEAILAEDDVEAETRLHYVVLDQVITSVNTAESLAEYVAQVKDQAQNMQNSKVLQGSGGWQGRNIQATLDVFSNLEDLPVTAGNDEPIKGLLDYGFEIIFMVLIAFLVADKTVEEKHWGMGPLLHLAPKGRSRLAVWRLFGIILAGSLSAAGILAGTLGASIWFYGGTDLSRLIQSVPEFYNFPYPMTVAEFLLVVFGIMWLGQTLLTVLFTLLMELATDSRIAVPGGVLILVLSTIPNQIIPSQSALACLKYCSPVAFIRWMDYLPDYYNLRIGGWVVNRTTFMIAVQGILLLAISAGAILTMARRYPVRTPGRAVSRIIRLMDRVSECYHAKVSALPARCIDLYRFLISQKGILIFLIFALFLTSNYSGEEIASGGDVRLLHQYYSQWEGELTEAAKEEIAALGSEIEEAQANLDALVLQFQNNEINQETYERERSSYLNTIDKEAIYLQIKEAADSVTAQEEMGYQAWIVDPAAYISFFYESGQTSRIATLLAQGAVIWICFLIYGDYRKRDLRNMLRCTDKGYRKMGKWRMRTVCVSAIAISILRFSIVFASIQSAQGFHLLNAPAHSLEMFSGLPVNPPLWMMVVLWCIVKSLPLVALAAVMSLAITLLENAAVVVGVLCVLPGLITLIGNLVLAEWTAWELESKCTQALTGGGVMVMMVFCAVTVVSAMGAEHAWRRTR